MLSYIKKGGVAMLFMLCDDRERELEELQRLIADYAGEHPELSLTIQCFSSPLDMLDKIDRGVIPDVALLDICMPGVLGTEIAQNIQSKSIDTADIIFLTTSAEFAVEAFSLHANDYLVKPYTKKRLFEALDRVVGKRQGPLYLPIQSGNEVHRIALYSIAYAEARNHNLEVHLKSGACLRTRMTLTELKALFRNISGFVPVGASYLVNLRCVQSLLPTTVVITTGEAVPVPRRLRGQLRKQYFDFYTKEATEQ